MTKQIKPMLDLFFEGLIMQFLLVYIDTYDRSERMRMFKCREHMDTFIKREEVRSIVSIYELKEIA